MPWKAKVIEDHEACGWFLEIVDVGRFGLPDRIGAEHAEEVARLRRRSELEQLNTNSLSTGSHPGLRDPSDHAHTANRIQCGRILHPGDDVGRSGRRRQQVLSKLTLVDALLCRMGG